MPYRLQQSGSGWVVVNSETGKPKSRKPLPRARALAQMRALYANNPEARTKEAGHTGVMLAFFVPASALPAVTALQEGLPNPEPAEDLHLTLAYLGQSSELAPYAALIDEVLTGMYWGDLPLSGRIGGIGRFHHDEGNGTNAVYASFDSPALPAFRQRLIEMLTGRGIPVVQNHGFTPHITLAYVPLDTDISTTPRGELPELTFGAFTLAWGDTRIDYGPGAGSIAAKLRMLTVDDLRTKAANFGARAGETIVGSLGRAGNGQFTTAGSPAKQPARASDPRRPATPAKQPASPRDPQRPAVAPRTARPRTRAMQTNRRRVAAELKRAGTGVGPKSMAAMDAIRTRKYAEKLSPAHLATLDILKATGMVRKFEDGSFELTDSGKAFMEASDRGDARAARAAIATKKQPLSTKAAMGSAERRAMFAKLGKSGAHARDSKQVKRARRDVVFARRSLRTQLAKGKPTNEIGKRDLRQARSNLQHAERSYTRTYADAVHALNTGRMPYATKALTVLKDASGHYRWLTFSSTAFRDRDGEIVSTKALEDDVTRADGDGDYGPLRWWHVPGLDIGDCDFNAMHGRTLIESGTFRDERYGPLVAAHADELGVSIGFKHGPDQPDGDKVFHRIHRFERSLLPVAYPSNLFTGLVIQETKTVDEKKIAGLKALGFDDDAIAAIQTQATAREKAAEAAGVTFKEVETTPVETAVETVVEETADDTVYVGDLTPDAFIELQQRAYAPLMAALNSQATTKAAQDEATATALKAATEQLAATTTRIGGLETELATAKAQVASLVTTVKELSGDVPAGIKRASQDPATLLPDGHALKSAVPEADPLDGFVNGFVMAGTPAG